MCSVKNRGMASEGTDRWAVDEAEEDDDGEEERPVEGVVRQVARHTQAPVAGGADESSSSSSSSSSFYVETFCN